MNFKTLFISLFLFSTLIACTPQSSYQKEHGEVWNTLYNITYLSDISMRDSITYQFDLLSKSVSVFDSKSIVSKVNASSDSCAVDKIFVDVFNKSFNAHKISNGAFDPTISPLISAWGFGKGHKASADTLHIDSIRAFCGLEKTRIVDNTLYKTHPNLQFNFSAIAKGYGVDMIAEMFERNGIHDYLIEVGGEIRCSGKSSKGKKWNIAIDAPEAESTYPPAQLTIEADNCGIATSGNYRNFHEGKSGKYGHTINPATGRPAITDIASATVISPSCADADALATACMVLGMKGAEKMVIENNIAAVLISAQNTIWVSPAMKKFIK